MEKLASKRNYWYALSAVLVTPGLIALLLWGLNLGIDFTGGTIWELKFDQTVTTEQVRDVLSEHGYTEGTVQLSSDDGLTDNIAIIRTEALPEGSGTKDAIEQSFLDEIGPFEELQISTVGSSVSNQISQRSIYAILAASVGILLYMAWAFRNTQNPALYGLSAIAAMVHDIIFVLGIFAILGHFADVQVDALFVTAILTVIGFSVHDTIVVFDRVRENLAAKTDSSFEEVVNYSLAQTIVRSVNTSLTVIFTLLALYFFGGESTRTFVLALLIGIVIGTYSSIFNASQLLVSWELGDFRHLRDRLRGRKPEATAPATR